MPNGSKPMDHSRATSSPWPSRVANLFAGTDRGIFLSTNNGANWTPAGAFTPSSFAVDGTTLFAGTNGAGINRSTNNGIDWAPVDNGLPANCWVMALASVSNGGGATNLFAGIYGSGVFLSTNDGANWTPVDSGLPANCSVMSLATSQSGGSATSVFAGTSRYGVFLSTNNGTTWTQVSTGLPFSSSVPYYGYYDVTTLLHAGQNLFAGIWGAESTVPLTTEQLGH